MIITISAALAWSFSSRKKWRAPLAPTIASSLLHCCCMHSELWVAISFSDLAMVLRCLFHIPSCSPIWCCFFATLCPCPPTSSWCQRQTKLGLHLLQYRLYHILLLSCHHHLWHHQYHHYGQQHCLAMAIAKWGFQHKIRFGLLQQIGRGIAMAFATASSVTCLTMGSCSRNFRWFLQWLLGKFLQLSFIFFSLFLFLQMIQ